MRSSYYLLKNGFFEDEAELLFSNEDGLIPYVKGDKIFYNNKEYTIIHIKYYLEDCDFSNAKGRYKYRRIYLREVK